MIPCDPNDSLKSLLKPLDIRGTDAFVHQVMRRVRAVETSVTPWVQVWSRWAWPTLVFSTVVFAITLVHTLQPEMVSADSWVEAWYVEEVEA